MPVVYRKPKFKIDKKIFEDFEKNSPKKSALHQLAKL